MGFLLEIIVVLLIVGVVLWAMTQFPIDATIARVIRVVIIVFVAIWLIMLLFSMVGSVGGGPSLFPSYPYRH